MNFIKSIVFLISMLTFSFSLAISEPRSGSKSFIGGGDFVPWPLNLQVPFPWSDAEGVWRSQAGEDVTFYKFTRSGSRILQITQFDGTTCRIIAEGKGLERNKLVVAQMYNYSDKSTQRLVIGAFKPSDISCADECAASISSEEKVLVLSLPALRLGKNTQSLILSKEYNQCGSLFE